MFGLSDAVIVGVLSLIGTLGGSLAGIIASNRLTVFRLSKLEEKVAKHNNLIERMYVVEESAKSAHHRIDELREEINND